MQIKPFLSPKAKPTKFFAFEKCKYENGAE